LQVITAFTTNQPIDHLALYTRFLEREDDRSGTVVLHHGRVKRPGKHVHDFSSVELAPLCADTDELLAGLARRALERFTLNQVLIVHRLGIVQASDSVLVAIVSGVARDQSFDACRWIVDEIKKEDFIQLTEHAVS
jgi:molybdopterin synthase catalytic subunit